MSTAPPNHIGATVDRDFERQAVAYIAEHSDTVLDDHATRLGIPPTSAKQDGSNVVRKLIDDGPPAISMLDFAKRRIHVHTVRVPQNDDRPFEPMTFRVIQPFALARETWEASELREDLGRLFITVIRGADGAPQRSFFIDFAFFWSPEAVQERDIRREWRNVQLAIMYGPIDHLPTESETEVLHVKPKGKAGGDLVDAPAGRMRRSSFALNTGFIEGLISTAR